MCRFDTNNYGTSKTGKKKQPVSNRNLSTETHVGMPHAEMIVELFIVDKEVLN